MEERIAYSICNKLAEKNVIKNDYFDVYKYGLELIVSTIISIFIVISVGIILKQIDVTLIFLAVFIGLRRFTGGYHASTYIKCKICMITVYLIYLVLTNFTNISTIAVICQFCVGIVLITLLCPIENDNKPLKTNVKKKSKITSLILFTTLSALCIVLSLFMMRLSNAVFYSESCVIALIILSIIHRRFKDGKVYSKDNS